MSESRNRTSPLSIIAVLLTLLIMLLVVLFGVEENANQAYNRLTDSEKVETLVRDLRAPGDPSTVATSSLGMAFQIREEVTTDVSKGMTKPEILQAMVDEYGPDVLAVPRFEGFGMATFIAPLVVLFAVLALVIYYLFRSVSPRVYAAREKGAAHIDKEKIELRLKDYL